MSQDIVRQRRKEMNVLSSSERIVDERTDVRIRMYGENDLYIMGLGETFQGAANILKRLAKIFAPVRRN